MVSLQIAFVTLLVSLLLWRMTSLHDKIDKLTKEVQNKNEKT